MLHRRHLLLSAYALLCCPARAEKGSRAPLSNSIVAHSAGGDIRSAWLFGPTDRYPHFVLGDRFEAMGLAVEDAQGRHHEVLLPPDAVFEDRVPRIADLDRDGRNEVAIVISTLKGGAALALFGLENGHLRLQAQTAPIGQANRWLNPSGIGRFTRAGTLNIALVRTPHLKGILEIWGYANNTLTQIIAVPGYSTHRLGSRHQRMFAVLPMAAGHDRLVVPTLDRRALALMDFTAAKPERARYALPAAADGAMVATRTAQGLWRISVTLEDGNTTHITLPA